MTTNPSPDSPRVIDYQTPPQRSQSTGCLVLAIIFAVMAAAGILFGAQFMHVWSITILAFSTIGLIAGGIFAFKRGGLQGAMAIVLVAIAIFCLMFGLCAAGNPLAGI